MNVDTLLTRLTSYVVPRIMGSGLTRQSQVRVALRLAQVCRDLADDIAETLEDVE